MQDRKKNKRHSLPARQQRELERIGEQWERFNSSQRKAAILRRLAS